MIKLFVTPKQERLKKEDRPAKKVEAVEKHGHTKAPKDSKKPTEPPHDLYWDGYSDLGYC